MGYFDDFTVGVSWVSERIEPSCKCGVTVLTEEHKKTCLVYLTKGPQLPEEGTAYYDPKTDCGYVFNGKEYVIFTGPRLIK